MKTKEQMIDEIMGIVSYTPVNQINTVYMGSMATAHLYHLVGANYGETPSLRKVLENCPKEQLEKAYKYTENYRKHRDRQEREDDQAAIRRLRARGYVIQRLES